MSIKKRGFNLKVNINKKFESKDKMLFWLRYELDGKCIKVGSFIFQEDSTGSKKPDQWSIKGYLVSM